MAATDWMHGAYVCMYVSIYSSNLFTNAGLFIGIVQSKTLMVSWSWGIEKSNSRVPEVSQSASGKSKSKLGSWLKESRSKYKY